MTDEDFTEVADFLISSAQKIRVGRVSKHEVLIYPLWVQVKGWYGQASYEDFKDFLATVESYQYEAEQPLKFYLTSAIKSLEPEFQLVDRASHLPITLIRKSGTIFSNHIFCYGEVCQD